MSELTLYVFGPPRLERRGLERQEQPVEARPRKALALFIYLAVTRQPHSRDALATLLWPEYDQTAARASLRRTIHRLHESLNQEVLAASLDTVSLNPQCNLRLDLDRYREIVAECLPAQSPTGNLDDNTLARLTEAAQLYTGDFLAGFNLPDCPEFDDWQFFQREELRQSLAHVLERLAEAHEARAEYDAAIAFARRRLALDPLHEQAHRRLMQLYAWAGRQAAALRQYQECERILAEELDVTPEEETRQLYDAIKSRQLEIPAPPAAASDPAHPEREARAQDAVDAGAERPTRRDIPHRLPHRLPPPPTVRIGRETELEQVRQLLLNEPACRLLTLIGPGGTGKTHLALQVAHGIVEGDGAALDGQTPQEMPFADGVYFVPLAPVSTADGIVVAIAEVLGFNFYSQTSLRGQLLDHLRAKHMLLALDNFEHLVEAQDVLADILACAPGVKILLTSHVGTNLREEWSVPLFGLRFPTTVLSSPQGAPAYEEARAYEAVQLFEQCARRARPDFSLTAEQEHVLRICRLVEGMPLALELAAAWLKALPAQVVAEELEHSLDILTARYQNTPSRHHSMRAVLDQTWTLLDEDERDALKRHSVFRGGFSQEAAHAVTGASRLMLASLMGKSLLRRSDEGRYHLHELLRQFASDRLQAEPNQYEQVRQRYCAYYAGFLAEQKAKLQGGRQKEALDQIGAELDNIRTAWHWAVERREVALLAQAAQGFWLFCHYRGALHEGEAAFGEAVRALLGTQDADSENGAAGILLAGYGWIQARRGDAENGRKLVERGIALLQQVDAKDDETFARGYLGAVAQFQERFREAKEIGQQCAEYFAAQGNPWGVATCYELMGSSELGNGRLKEAEELLQTSLEICRRLGESRVRFLDAISLAIIATELGDYSRAGQLLNEAVQMCRDLNDRIGMAFTLQCMGRLAVETGEYAQALEHSQASRAIAAEIGALDLTEVLDYRGVALRLQGNYEAAQEYFEQSVRESEVRGLQRRLAHGLCNLGCIAYARQDIREAERLQRDALAKIRAFGNEPEIAWMLCQLGHTTAALGGEPGKRAAPSDTTGTDEARELYRQSLQLATMHRLAPVALETLGGVARLLIHAQQHQDAAELLALVAHHPATAHHIRERARSILAELASKLPGATISAARARGQALDWLTTTNQIFRLLSSPQRSGAPRPQNNLPAQPTPFVGRGHELADILRHLHDPNCRLLVLVGPGGIGKTRLALQTAQSLIDADYGEGRFADGIFFVGLAAVSASSGVAHAIATAVGLELQGDVQPERHLLDYLRDKRLLLVLDNFEHLLDAADLVSDIVSTAPGVKILATSREGLNLQGSWFYPIAGLSYPVHNSQSNVPAEEYEAVRLLVQSARRVRPDFTLEQDRENALRICRLVEGMPLAIELAATWLKMLSAEEIVAEIERGLDLLVNMQRDAPARHRSMRAVLEYSWRLLSDEERGVLARISVFRGGFHRHAADQVANAPLLTLAHLMDKSLIRVDAAGRYQLHTLLRQFAAEKLRESPQDEEETRDRHARYHLSFLSAREQQLNRKEMSIALAEIDREIDNISLAWERAATQENLDLMETSVLSLQRYYSVRGRSRELAGLLAQAVGRLRQSATAQSHPRYDSLMCALLANKALCEYHLSNFSTSAITFQECLDLARKLDDKKQMAESVVGLGSIAGRQGDLAAAEKYIREGLAHFRECDSKDGVADALHELAHVHGYKGDYQEARRLATESLALSRQMERLDWIGYALEALGWFSFSMGNYADARRYYEESLENFRKVGHQLGTAIAIGGLGIVAWAAGRERLPEAISLLEESLAICRRIGHRLHTTSRLVHLAQAFNDGGDYVQAQRYALEGLSIADDLGSGDFEVYLECCLAESAYCLGDFKASRNHLIRALTLGLEGRFTLRLLTALYHWAVLLLKEAELPDTPASVAERSRTQAAELLVIAAHHPLNWRAFRERADALLSDLRRQLPPEFFLALEARAESRTIEELASDLLVESAKARDVIIRAE